MYGAVACCLCTCVCIDMSAHHGAWSKHKTKAALSPHSVQYINRLPTLLLHFDFVTGATSMVLLTFIFKSSNLHHAAVRATGMFSGRRGAWGGIRPQDPGSQLPGPTH